MGESDVEIKLIDAREHIIKYMHNGSCTHVCSSYLWIETALEFSCISKTRSHKYVRVILFAIDVMKGIVHELKEHVGVPKRRELKSVNKNEQTFNRMVTTKNVFNGRRL